MKILFCISTLTGGGAERVVSNITTRLPYGVEADLLLNSVSDKDFSTNANIINIGMKPVKKKNLLYQTIAFFKRVKILKKLKQENNYDACISFLDSANICNIVSGTKKCKVIISVHGNLTDQVSQHLSYRLIVKPMVRLFYNFAYKVVAVSNGVAQDLVENFKVKANKVVTIYNGFPIEEIVKKSYDEVELPVDWRKTFITVGRLDGYKGHWHLIRAFSQLAKRDSNVTLLILGEGYLDEYLKKLVRDLHLEKQIRFMGFCENPFAFIRKSRCFVFPSQSEGFGNVLVEALACGTPCIATDFDFGAREILSENDTRRLHLEDGYEIAKYGILTPVCSGTKYTAKEPLEKEEILLGEAMERILKDDELYYKLKGVTKERAACFEMRKKVSEWVNLCK